jgi:hypothetical protein
LTSAVRWRELKAGLPAHLTVINALTLLRLVKLKEK